MTFSDYLIDSALVLLVLLQIKERELTLRAMIRPLIITGIAVVTYLHGIPTAGNDLVVIAVLATIGSAIGLASGQAVIMRTGDHGEVLARSGWLSGFYWVLGMGGRFAFIFWATHWGREWLGTFSVQHAISGGDVWTAALLAMAVCEVTGRSLVQALRRRRLQEQGALAVA